MLILEQKPERWTELRLAGRLLCRVQCQVRGNKIFLVFDPHPHLDIVRDNAVDRLPRRRSPIHVEAAEATDASR